MVPHNKYLYRPDEGHFFRARSLRFFRQEVLVQYFVPENLRTPCPKDSFPKLFSTKSTFPHRRHKTSINPGAGHIFRAISLRFFRVPHRPHNNNLEILMWGIFGGKEYLIFRQEVLV